MATTAFLIQPRGIDHSLPTCGETKCSGRGTCVVPPGGGADLICECNLGYRGESCEDTMNGQLSLPLTLSVLAVIIGLLVMAVIFAKLRQRQKRLHRYREMSLPLVQKLSQNISDNSISTLRW